MHTMRILVLFSLVFSYTQKESKQSILILYSYYIHNNNGKSNDCKSFCENSITHCSMSSICE